MTGQAGVEGHLVEGALVHEVLHHQTGCEHGGEERAADTDYQGNGKTADGTRTEHNQNGTSDDGRQVRVEDGRECILVTIADGGFQALTGTQLLLTTLEDKHVGVHRHTQRQYDTGDTGQRQHALERGEDTDGEEQVQDQTQVGNHTSLPAVGANHEDHQQHEGYDERPETLLDGFLTQRRANHVLTGDVDTCHHLTGLEHVGKVVSLLEGELTTDLRTATSDPVVNIRIRVNLVIEHDGDSLTDVGTGDTGPLVCTMVIHGHRYDLTLHVVKLALGAGYDLTGQHGLILNGLQCNQTEHIGSTLNGLHCPSQLQILRQDGLSHLRVDDLVDSSGIDSPNIAHNR